MEINWSEAEADKLGQKYKSFVSEIESQALRRLILRGMGLFIEFPAVCKDALSTADAQLKKYQETLGSPNLLITIESLRKTNNLKFYVCPTETTDRYGELIKIIEEMQSRQEKFFTEYRDLFSEALREVIFAAKTLNKKLNGQNFSRDLSTNVVLDLAGTVVPALGTANFLRQRVFERSKYLHQQLQNSAGDADSFSSFSDFMEIVTQRVKDGKSALVEELKVFIDFADQELPASIKNLTALKI